MPHSTHTRIKLDSEESNIRRQYLPSFHNQAFMQRHCRKYFAYVLTMQYKRIMFRVARGRTNTTTNFQQVLCNVTPIYDVTNERIFASKMLSLPLSWWGMSVQKSMKSKSGRKIPHMHWCEEIKIYLTHGTPPRIESMYNVNFIQIITAPTFSPPMPVSLASRIQRGIFCLPQTNAAWCLLSRRKV